MKIGVLGLWHLGCVTAACLAKSGSTVIGYDSNKNIINDLKNGKPPLFEPGLEELISQQQSAGNLHFTNNASDLADSDIIWVTLDTPVDESDIADVAFVTNQVSSLFPVIRSGTLVLISSQVPVGSTRKLANLFHSQYPDKKVSFGYIPENLRLGKAIQVFTQTDRFVVGLENSSDKEKVQTLLSPFTATFVWMSIESAEMTKHALNAFLATCVVFINELAGICEDVGANAYEVEQGLKSEERIGKKAYLRPGGAIGGGTLLRDINFLQTLAKDAKRPSHLISAILDGNAHHKNWLLQKVSTTFADLRNKTFAVLGLTYKPDTSTLRRSTAIEASSWLHQQGANVKAFDPLVNSLPDEYQSFIQLTSSWQEALKQVDGIIIGTECPQFKDPELIKFLSSGMPSAIFDPGSFLGSLINPADGLRYYAIGRSA